MAVLEHFQALESLIPESKDERQLFEEPRIAVGPNLGVLKTTT